MISFQENLRAARLTNFPSINGSASYGTTSSDAGGGSFRNSGQIGLTLTVPVYDRGVTRAETAQAQAQLDNANAQLLTTTQGVQLNVRQGLVNLVSGVRRARVRRTPSSARRSKSCNRPRRSTARA